MTLKTLATLVICLLSSGAYAQSNLPVCHDDAGHPVQVIAIADQKYGPAFSLDYQGVPTIMINMEQMHKYLTSNDSMTYAYEHECGHCALGHIYNQATDNYKQNQDELAADCYA